MSECVEALPESEIANNSNIMNGEKANFSNGVVEEKITVMEEKEFVRTEEERGARVHCAKDYERMETEETPAPEGKWNWKFDDDEEDVE